MEVKVGSYLQDDSTGMTRDFHVTLTDDDGHRLFPKNWEAWSIHTQVKKLRAMADIYIIQYAASRGFRDSERAAEEIEVIIAKDLQ